LIAMKMIMRVIGKMGGKSKKTPTLYINVPWTVAQKLGLNLNDYVIMEVDEEAKKITLKKLELESIPS